MMHTTEHHPPQVPPSVALHRMMSGHWIAQAIYVTAKLGVADHLTDGPKHVDALALSVGAHAGALYRLLRALASVGVFTEVVPQHFALTPIGACLQTGIPGSLRALALRINEIDWAAGGHMSHKKVTRLLLESR
ncbi:MAG: hypothetical protein HYZ72_10315 [Deltaproteobacteria bacterium]|nr:hypothetical protein [Deltaproteobacteria bacterium]